MSNRNLKILFIITFILLVFLGVKTSLPRLSPTSSPYQKQVKTLDKNSLKSILIKKTDKQIELKKENNIWKINSKKADSGKIESLVNYLLPAIPPELIAQTDKRHAEFELTDEKAAKVRLDNKLTWYIGKSSGTSVYSRFDKENSVYLLSGLSPYDLSVNADDWYDKTILSFDQSKVSKVSFKDKSGEKKIIKKDNKWLFEKDDKEVNQDKINSVLASLSNLLAKSLAEDKELTNFPKNPELTITVDYDSQSQTLEFYKGKEDYLVKRQSDGEKFLIAEYSLTTLLSAPKDLSTP